METIDLVSCDNIRHPVEAGKLRTESSVFASMLDIPQDGTDVTTEVRLTEDSLVLGLITAFVSALPCTRPEWCTIPVLSSALTCADKYGIHNMERFVRIYVCAYFEELSQDPLALYIFVRNHGWEEFYWRASRETLKINIDDFTSRAKINNQLLRGQAVQLRSLHQVRKDILVGVVHGAFRTLEGSACDCGWAIAEDAVVDLIAFRHWLLAAIDIRPLGEFMWSVDVWGKEGGRAVEWKCGGCGCYLIGVGEVMSVLNSDGFREALAEVDGVY